MKGLIEMNDKLDLILTTLVDVKKEISDFKKEMSDFKEEMLVFKNEMTGFKEEMLVFKNEMTDFKEDMLVFKNEMTSFKEEMLAFKNEMTDFKEQALSRLDSIEHSIHRIESGQPVDIKAMLQTISDKLDDRDAEIQVLNRRVFKVESALERMSG